MKKMLPGKTQGNGAAKPDAEAPKKKPPVDVEHEFTFI